MSLRLLCWTLCLALAATSASAYTIYLKDGSRIEADRPYTVEGERALILLPNGTQTFIALAEIDIERTQSSNVEGSTAGTLVLEDGRFVEMKDTETPEVPRQDKLRDLIARGDATASSRSRAPSPTTAGSAVDTPTRERRPFRNLAAAEILKDAFVERGLVEAAVLDGDVAGQPRIEVTTNSEAAVFRGLQAAAAALIEATTAFPEIQSLELDLFTTNHARAGFFRLNPEQASQLAEREVEPSAFFVQNVLF